ncbi:MAG: DUF362 domain-containing protein [Bacteroidales bacterium]|nr:DUF362 domain-containing protein [Bacteroidales bacterium]
MDATPEMVLSILKQLVGVVGIAQSNIFIGDPFRTFRDNYYDLCHSVYPNVNYCDGLGINGRHQTVPTSEDLLVLSNGEVDVRIPQEYVDASYFINMPCLKSHDAGGITIAAKITRDQSYRTTPVPMNNRLWSCIRLFPLNDGSAGSNHRYRHLVDYMGHEHLGGKTLLVIVDGIWAGRNWDGRVEKWVMAPFNNDYPSSLFISQDLVAIEAVCFDFLLEEYKNKPSNQKYPYYAGTEDYIKQAADPANWADGISYDPENDGTPIGSLGVSEHWNNATDKKYTRDLGTGSGIELVKVTGNPGPPGSAPVNALNTSAQKVLLQCYPNPATSHIFFEYDLASPARVKAEIITLDGKKVETLFERNDYTGNHQVNYSVENLPAGMYLMTLTVNRNTSTIKFQVN